MKGIRATIARGRRAAREDALSSSARAFLLFVQIAEREGFEEAQQIFRRIARVMRENRDPIAVADAQATAKRKGARALFDVRLSSLWRVWKSQNPRGTELQFARWWFKEWPHQEFKNTIADGSLAKRLKRVLAKKNGPA
jgi:hypothetical protein